MIEEPLNVEIKSQTKTPETSKKALKLVLTTLHVHPCYLVKLYITKQLTNIEFIKFTKDIYRYPTLRTNYLLMSVIENILKEPDALEVDLLSKDSVIAKLFL